MKPYLSLFSFILLFVTGSCSQNLQERNVPAPVKSAFREAYDHPGLVHWSKEGKNEYEVSFLINGVKNSITYSAAGTWEEIETSISNQELPAGITDWLLNNYKNPRISEAAKILKRDSSIFFEVEVKGKDLYFDAAGKLLPAEN